MFACLNDKGGGHDATRGAARAGAYYAGSLALGIPVGLLLKRYGPELGLVGIVGLSTFLFAAAHAGFLWYWRGLDEAARAAHKDAFFWGGLAAHRSPW